MFFPSDENIADNGGLRLAYNAYNNWVEHNGLEQTLPGLKFNQHQLFWISAAQVWCTVSLPEHNRNQITTDPHSPFQFRATVPISNMPEFAEEFNCLRNPLRKCEIWS